MSIDDIITQCEDPAERSDLLEERCRQLENENQWLKEQFLLAQRKQFGSSSEKTDPRQLGLAFNEAEATLDQSAEGDDEKTVTYTRKKKTVGHREASLADLPTETVEHRLPEEEQICSCCGGHLHEMSAQTRDELVVIPAQVKVIKHLRYVYGCRQCDRNGDSVPIITAPGPKPLIEKSLASASAVAHIMGLKYVESMPLYRIAQHFERLGVELPRSLLSNWVLKGGEKLFPIYDHMKKRLLTHPVLHADETTLQVLKEEGRAAESKSYIWLYRSASSGPPIVLYEYQTTRSGEHPKRFLSGFTGGLHVDGYAAYDGLPGVELIGCWAHVRRRFVDAQKVLPKASQNDPKQLVNAGLGMINALFSIESSIASLDPAGRLSARQERSKPIIDAMKTWLDMNTARVLPKSALGSAISYCLNQWTKLTAFLKNGAYELSNNRAERSIKPFVIGRKNWLFSNTPRGAHTSAVIYSVVETAKENGLNPSTYLEYVLNRLNAIDPSDRSALDEILPWSDSVKSALA